MSLILSIETALDTCSVAIGDDGKTILKKQEKGTNLHAARLTVLIQSLFAEADKKISDLRAVAVSKGPGSYTGLRIGVSAAKGICYALGIPLIAINTLEGLARNALPKLETSNFKLETLLCPMIDARRMEVYCAVYDRSLTPIRSTEAVIIDQDSFQSELSRHSILFFGNGMPKCRDILSQNPNSLFLEGIEPDAEFLLPPAFEKFNSNDFEDLALFEPFYLKEFIAGKKKQE